ncbi:hypothetical protein LDBUL1519_00148 [Lactobacillus delbrueckii subsp. bulgaricus CNCM I-1519]|nr:hypothetical protein LDBUL1519_00148 [Lactobacillus delbrueckii subsp. bulgaricus CNCM I-1519]
MALTGVAAIGLGTNGQADAATIGDSVTVDYIDGQSIATWSNYYTATVTGSVKDGSSWKVVKTARDASGEKWYKIGKRQWIMAKYTTEASTTSNSTYNANTTSTNTANSTYNANTTSTNTANSTYNANTTSTNTANSTTGTGYTTSYSSSANNYGYGSNYNYTYSANTGAANTSSYSASTTSSSTSASTSTASASTSSSTSTSSSSSEEAAKAWIASKESGGSYTASNGNYYGKYQLSLSYLNGDTSAANQEKVANSYVQSRYGSWTAAKAFWQANGWY